MQDRSAYRMHDITVEECAPGRLTLLVIYSNGRLRNDDRLVLPVRIEDERQGLSAHAACYVRMTCPLGYTADILSVPAHSTIPCCMWSYDLCRAAIEAADDKTLNDQLAPSGLTMARIRAILGGEG